MAEPNNVSEQVAVEDDDLMPRFYLGIGIDQRRCAACAACPTLPCADHRDAEPCSGASDCSAGLHEHGCFADLDGTACNDPEDHDA